MGGAALAQDADKKPAKKPAKKRAPRRRKSDPKTREISVIVPVFDEAGTLEELVQRVAEALSERDHEIVLVDDGSTDGSTDLIRKLAAEKDRVKGVIFRGNFGKAAALTAGFDNSTGRLIVTMDADLQESPEEIPDLLRGLAEGADIVSGWRHRRNDPWHKRWPSRLYNRVTARLTKVHIHDHNCGFKAYRREVWEEISIYGELHRYIPALAAWRRFSVRECKITHRPRRYGSSKYGVLRLFKGFLDLLTVLLLTRFLSRPLHFFGVVGSATASVGFAICAYLTALKLFWGEELSGRPLLLFGVLSIVVGIQLVSIGLLGEMLGHLHRERPEYSVKDVVGG